ncbi:30S ribosomal protein S20 [Egibacter rhizosphaerae]|uniref:Small ribosomal subunit protein bS20 n=1 Tax=Egibacter rhizosphaerae TaxID=1670831 RepID=A0A411YBV7_9ACTN|nr:30S ribosomal protein S20 [Egibacter rhizosphaerae]QBI18642.1 30S ribosomal protein S20 [Egibacter rhizosphaerae]
MPNIKSQEKRHRQNEARRLQNKGRRTMLRTHMKKFDEALQAGDVESAREQFRTASRELDKAVGKGVVHRNYAANRKSQMARRLTEVEA